MRGNWREPPALIDRLIELADFGGDPDDCVEWLGAKKGGGYGHMRIGGKNVGAHRVSYTVFVGPIPEDLVVDHKCRNKSCINPTHLEPVTQAENARRAREFQASSPGQARI